MFHYYIAKQFAKDPDIAREKWFRKSSNCMKILKLLKIMSDGTIVVRRYHERGVKTKSRRACERYGDREERFLFKQERLVYLNQLDLFLLRHNEFAKAAICAKKKKATRIERTFAISR